MFKLFKKKTELEKLNDQYAKLMKEAHALSTVDRKKSDEKVAESEKVLTRINELAG
ncbi:MAG: Lacal_2735 family protein [Crocinitomicaceae bacterium]|nr:Lacal_2735 family protein [Crocinitomicaceae bacterium]